MAAERRRVDAPHIAAAATVERFGLGRAIGDVDAPRRSMR